MPQTANLKYRNFPYPIDAILKPKDTFTVKVDRWG